MVVDVGTGSGAIAITLALERPGLRVIGVDRSAQALSFARENAGRFPVRPDPIGSVSFREGDLLKGFAPGSADLIAANLPYLDEASASDWPRELHWEPRLALDGGAEGLSLIERLIRQAGSVLKPGGRLLLEIGAGQGKSLAEPAEKNHLRLERIVPDLAGLDRVAVLLFS